MNRLRGAIPDSWLNSRVRSSPTCGSQVRSAEVLVDAGGLRVVVAGADVAVADQALGLLAHDEAQLGVGLQADDAVDDVDAGLLELAGPADVVDLVEAGLDLDDGEDLLAGLGGVDEGVDDRASHRRCGRASA